LKVWFWTRFGVIYVYQQWMEKDCEGGYVINMKVNSFWELKTWLFPYLSLSLFPSRGGEERLLIFDPIIGFGGYFAFEDFISHLERRRGFCYERRWSKWLYFLMGLLVEKENWSIFEWAGQQHGVTSTSFAWSFRCAAQMFLPARDLT
jgi:hypothetical protein